MIKINKKKIWFHIINLIKKKNEMKFSHEILDNFQSEKNVSNETNIDKLLKTVAKK